MASGEYKFWSEKGSAATALTFLFVGIGIGAVVALLFAPKSGRQMRRSIQRKYEDARDVIDDLSEQAGQRASEYVERGREWANAAKESVAPIARKIRRD